MNPYVGIIISLAVFGIGTWLFKKSKGFFLFTPLFVAMILGVVVLKVTGISYEQYNEGGKYISFFLEPATVAFAIPLYKKRDVLKKYWLEILTALTIGSFGSLVAVYFAGKVIGMDNHLAGLNLTTSSYNSDCRTYFSNCWRHCFYYGVYRNLQWCTNLCLGSNCIEMV